MPTYKYKCSECGQISEATHSMSDRLTDCEICSTIGTLNRVPIAVSVQYREQDTGKVVHEYIEQTKKEIDSEKEFLKTREWSE